VSRASNLSVLVVLLAAPAARADEVDDFVLAKMKEQRIPGLALAVVKDGKVVKEKGYGLANVEHGVPVKPETVFQSGSVGKMFTAAAVLLLAEDGKLSLDDPITKFFPDGPEGWKEVTVRHLLTHTAGIKNYGPLDLDYRKDYTEDELLKKIAGLKPDFPPGEKWRYSNTGYVLLGILIRKASGEFYGDVLKKRVFGPLGMETARVMSDADIVPNRAAGYRPAGKELKNQDYVSPSLNSTADGSLYVTVRDLVKWDAALSAGKVVKKESLEQMWTPVKTKDGKAQPYGFGWMIREAKGHKVIEHGGAWQGFTSHIAKFPDDGLTVIVLANLAGSRTNVVAHGVAGLYVPGLAGK
jgi:CubicO group peptidase (beta-lactamase class C family)